MAVQSEKPDTISQNRVESFKSIQAAQVPRCSSGEQLTGTAEGGVAISKHQEGFKLAHAAFTSDTFGEMLSLQQSIHL